MDSDAARLGRYGSIWCAQTELYTPPTGIMFCAMTFLSNTIFATATFFNQSMASASSTFVSMTFAKGQTIYGLWTSFQLVRGALIAYKVKSKDYAYG